MENKVILLGYYGGDKRHCLSAWQSTTEELGVELPTGIEDRVDVIFAHLARQKKKTPLELLEMLATHRHHTPFEKSVLDFQVTADVASHIHALKHRIGVSINAESARYKEFVSDKYYIPADFAQIRISQRSLEAIGREFGPQVAALIGELGTWDRILDWHSRLGFALYHGGVGDLAPELGRKRAKESARYFLGYNTQLNFDVLFNFRSFMHFVGLRHKPDAQREIDAIAARMVELAKGIEGKPFELSLRAFGL